MNNDFISTVDPANGNDYDSFFSQKPTNPGTGESKFEQETLDTPEKSDISIAKANPASAKGSTHIRLTNDVKTFCYRAHQCYQLATGKHLSLSSFIELCVKRALPHISKEASELMRRLPQ